MRAHLELLAVAPFDKARNFEKIGTDSVMSSRCQWSDSTGIGVSWAGALRAEQSKPPGLLSMPDAVPGLSLTPYGHTRAPVVGSNATTRFR